MTTSGNDAAFENFGKTSAALPQSPTESRAPLRLAPPRSWPAPHRAFPLRRVRYPISMRFAMRCSIDFDAEDGGLGHGAGQRLRATHPAEAGGEHKASGEVAAKMSFRDAHEDFVGSLNDTLRADILPVAGGEPAPADEILSSPARRTFRHWPICRRCCNWPSGRPALSAWVLRMPIGLPDCTMRVSPSAHRLERRDDLVVGWPVAGGATKRGIDDEVVGVLADRQNVLQQAQQTFLAPAFAAQARARGDSKRTFHDGEPLTKRIVGQIDPKHLFAHADRPRDLSRSTTAGITSLQCAAQAAPCLHRSRRR